jgi:hypothetical protein
MGFRMNYPATMLPDVTLAIQALRAATQKSSASPAIRHV